MVVGLVMFVTGISVSAYDLWLTIQYRRAVARGQEGVTEAKTDSMANDLGAGGVGMGSATDRAKHCGSAKRNGRSPH